MANTYTLRQISPTEVQFSKQNPRGETAAEIRNDPTFEQLKDSVAQFGVLVPIVVHKNKPSSKKKYVLVDGERRLRAATATQRDTIPAHVASSEDRMGELIQAFHIHMLRKQWKQVATARALRRIKEELRRKKIQKSDKDLLVELQAQTGCTDARLKSLERVIKYPESTLREVDEGRISLSHLVQFEASFVEQLRQHYSDVLKKLGERKVREVLTNKARKRILSSTRALIENVLPVISRAKSAKQKKYAGKLLERFINKERMPAEDIKKEFERRYPPSQDALELANNIIDGAEQLRALIGQIEVTQMVSFTRKAKEVRKSLEELRDATTNTLRQLRRYTS